ncbi:hypothetical protein RRG08_018305 [Elysia crispata]|uniref:Uncharacterized protein n=1 Tax=Elysia crispata TaxID=231223 RepID=A0AAE0YKN6_9GAST|nr:hypothetical protein RRG08_018305 [Elysia crispata]
MSLPSHSLSSETGGSDVTSYPTIQAFLGPNVTGLPTVIINERYILSFPLDLLEKFLKCLCDKRNTKCSLQASVLKYNQKKINHMISSVSVTNKAGAVAGKKDKLQMAYYICKYSGGTHQGFVDCSVDTDKSLIPDNSQWPPTDQDVCDFRCIYFHWRLFSQKKEQSVHYEHFGVGPSPDTGKFCIRPSEDVDQGRIGDGHKGDSHDDKGSGDPDDDTKDSHNNNTGSTAGITTDSSDTDNDTTDSDGKKSGYMPIDVKDNVRDSDIKDDSNKDIDIQDDSSKDSDIKDDSSRDSGNKVGFGPTHHITDNRSDVEFLLVCIAFGASVLANIVLGVCLWCSRRRQRRSQAELNELTGVENLTYFGEDNVRAETSFGNSRYGVDRISAADIDISTNQRDTEVPLGAAAVGFVNNGFIPFNNSGEKSLNVNHFEDSDPSASSNNISTQHATQSDVNYESFDTGPSAQVTTENVDEPHYAIPRHSQVHVQGTRSTRPAPDQHHSPRLDSSPYGTSQLPEPDPNSSNNFRGTGNEYVDEASLWGAREPQLLTDAGQAVAIIDNQRPQRKSQRSEFTMRSIANGVSGSSAANCGDMDGLYTEPRENVYSEI